MLVGAKHSEIENAQKNANYWYVLEMAKVYWWTLSGIGNVNNYELYITVTTW